MNAVVAGTKVEASVFGETSVMVATFVPEHAAFCIKTLAGRF